MKFTLKTMLMGMGSIAAVAAPVAAVVACDNDTPTKATNKLEASVDSSNGDVTVKIENSATKATIADLAKAIKSKATDKTAKAILVDSKISTNKVEITVTAKDDQAAIETAIKNAIGTNSTNPLCVELATK